LISYPQKTGKKNTLLLK